MQMKSKSDNHYGAYPKGTTILAMVYTIGGNKNRKMVDADKPIMPSAPIWI